MKAYSFRNNYLVFSNKINYDKLQNLRALRKAEMQMYIFM